MQLHKEFVKRNKVISFTADYEGYIGFVEKVNSKKGTV